jgi:choline dehydrogenase-like flavoprotein
MLSPIDFPRILPTPFSYWKQAARTAPSQIDDFILFIVEHRNANVLDIIVPLFGPRATPDTPQDWNYTTTPQAGFGGRSIAYPRGFVLGGSSSVSKRIFSHELDLLQPLILISDYMAYTRGSKEDFDRWAKVTEDNGWSWDKLVPYMRKVIFLLSSSLARI